MSAWEDRELERLHDECSTIVAGGEFVELLRCQEGGREIRCDRPRGHVGCHSSITGGLRFSVAGFGRVRALYPRKLAAVDP